MTQPQHYFPEGVPESIRRIVNPDSIMRIVNQEVKKLGKKWSRNLAPVANDIVTGKRPWWKVWVRRNPAVDSGHVRSFLYGPESRWPQVSKAQKNLLRVLKATRNLGDFSTDPIEGPPPDPKEVAAAFHAMAKDTDSRILTPIWNDLINAALGAGSEIEDLCYSEFGEECTQGDGAEIFAEDLRTAVKLDQLEGDSYLRRLMGIIVPLWK